MTDVESEHIVVTRRAVNLALLGIAVALAGGARRVRAEQPLFDFAIAGGHYHGLGKMLEQITPGMMLDLRREPHNPHDGNAIAVWLNDVMLGYVPRDANTPVAALMDRGEVVRAEVVRLTHPRHVSDIPDDLVFTSFCTGDPIIRLSTFGPA